MSPPQLSICIANWNARGLLRACLRSLSAGHGDLQAEIIVVDNGSTDGSAEMIAAEFPDVVLVRNGANRGFARASNQAAALSRGRYLLFLNNDTLVPPSSLGRLVSYLHAHPEVGMVGPRLVGRDGSPQRSFRGRPTLGALLHRLPFCRGLGLFRAAYEQYRRAPFDASQQREVDALLGAAVCLPRDVFFQHGGWDEAFPFGLEDFDLCARVAQTHAVVFLPDVQIVHLGRMSSRENPAYVYTSVECGYARYLRKHLGGAAVVGLYKLLVTLNLPIALGIETVREHWRRWRRGPAAPGAPHSELAALWHFSTRGLRFFWRC